MVDKTLEIILKAKDEASKTLQNFDKTLEKTGGTLGSIGSALGKVALGAVALGTTAVVVGKKMVDAFAESEQQMAIANTTVKTFSDNILKTMGGSIEVAQKKVADFGDTIQKKLGFSGEEASIAITKLTQTTGDYTKAQELMALATDLARYKQIDLGTAVTAVSKMYGGSTKELNAMGIATDENATAQQNLKMLMGLTAGQAEAYANTIKGKTDILKETFGDLQEKIGGLLLPIATKVLEKFMEFMPVIDKVIDKVAQFIKKIVESEVTKTILGIIRESFKLLWDAVMQLWNALQPYLPFIQMLAQLLGGVLLTAFMVLVATIKIVLMTLTGLLNMFRDIYNFIKVNLVQAVGEDIKKAIEVAGNAFDWLKGVVKSVFSSIKSFIDPIIDTISNFINKIINIKDSITGFFSNIGSGVSKAVTSVFGGGKASGGSVFTGRSYMVGENGPEIFTPNEGGTIIPNNKLNSGTTINITVTGNQLLDRDSGKKIADAIFSELKLKANII